MSTAPERGHRTFTYDEALASFPVVRDLTEAAVRQVEALVNRVQSVAEMEARQEELHAVYRRIVDAWAEELASVGCEAKGLWLVDWDAGSGYWCWRHPEPTIGFFHSYEDGFAGRVPVA